ncbi:MAG: tetratricopeptide repeat protein [Armatimonadota bacterium]
MNRKSSRLTKTGIAFLLSFAATALVWQSGHRAGLEDADAPSPHLTPPAPSAFTDPATAALTEGDFARRVARLTEESRQGGTPAEVRQRSRALYELARAAHFQSKGGGQLSLTAYGEALRLSRLAGDRPTEAEILVDQSDTLQLLGQSREAEVSLRASLAIRDAGVGTAAQRADALYRLGDFLQARGQHDEARTTIDRALRLQQRLGNEPGMADCLRTLGQSAYEEGSLALSRQLLGNAIRLFEKHGKIESRAAVLGQLGDVALREGDVTEAKALYEEGLHVWQERKQGFWTGRFLVRLANVALEENDIDRAKELAQKGDRLLSASNGPVVRARALLVLSKVAAREGKQQEALRYVSEAEALYDASGNISGLTECNKVREVLSLSRQ